MSGYHCLLGQSFLHHSYASLLFSPTSVCFSVGNGKNKATFARKIDKASPYLKQQNCYVMSTTTSGPAQPSPMSHRERKKLYRHLNAGRTVGYRMVLTVASKSSTSSLATSLEPEIQKVIDKHSGPGGTLCGKIPDHTAAKGFQCHLNIHPDAHPSFCKQYRLTPMEKEDLLTQVEAFIAKGWIEPSISPWSSSVLFIPKPNGKLRFCVDYRRLNAVTVGDQGPVPLTGELLDSLGGSVYFSALDLASGYYQLGMHPDSRPYTAFPTPYGLYQWKVMPMGLKTAPAIFQRAMNTILHTHIKAGRCLVYLDDIIIKSKSLQDHAQHLDLILNSLSEHSLFCQLPKCTWAQKELKYLGHIVTGDGVKPDPSKVSALDHWEPPVQHAKDLAASSSIAVQKTHRETIVVMCRRFLGFMNYFSRFLPRYASLASVLHDQTSDKAPPWSSACTTAWNALRISLRRATMMHHPDFSLPFHVYSDASLRAVGGVLQQDKPSQGMVPIAFCARKMVPAEDNYITSARRARGAPAEVTQDSLGNTG